LCSSWQDFDGHIASRGPSAVAELLVRHARLANLNVLQRAHFLIAVLEDLSFNAYSHSHTVLAAACQSEGLMGPEICNPGINEHSTKLSL